jgi:hypothetical protein
MDGDEIGELGSELLKGHQGTRTLRNLREAKKELQQIPYTGGIQLDGKNAGQVLALAAALVDHTIDQSWDRNLIRREFLSMLIILDAVSHRRRKEEKKKRKKKK